MAEIVMIQCDNPKCQAVGRSESENISPKKRPQKYAPPYGWILVGQIGHFGSGPYVKQLTVCGIDCLLPAVQSAFDSVER
jgi:hypothetical protein